MRQKKERPHFFAIYKDFNNGKIKKYDVLNVIFNTIFTERGTFNTRAFHYLDEKWSKGYTKKRECNRENEHKENESMYTLSYILFVSRSIVLAYYDSRSRAESSCKADEHVCNGAYSAYRRERVLSYKVTNAPSVERIV